MNLSLLFIFTLILFIICIVLLWRLYNIKKVSKPFCDLDLILARQEIQEQTFKNVSHQIHDHIGQLLSLAKLNLNTIAAVHVPGDLKKIGEAKNLISQSIRDLRSLSKILNAENILNIGLVKAVEMELQLVQDAGIKTVNLNVKGLTVRFKDKAELILYRLFQEALHQLIDHSKASIIEVKAIYDQNSFNLFITDNPFTTTDPLSNRFDIVLHKLQTRAKLIGATFEYTCTAEKGTIIHIYLPLIP